MSKGYQQYKQRQKDLSLLGIDLARRSKSRCELCKASESLEIFEVFCWQECVAPIVGKQHSFVTHKQNATTHGALKLNLGEAFLIMLVPLTLQ